MIYYAPFPVAENLVVDECAGIRRSVAQYVFQVTSLVAGDVQDAVMQVHGRVTGLHRTVDIVAFGILSYGVVTQVERYHLSVAEDVLYDMQGTVFCLLRIFFGIGVTLCLVYFRHAHTDGKLFATLGTLEDKLLAVFVFRFVKDYVIIAFWATYALHVNILFGYCENSFKLTDRLADVVVNPVQVYQKRSLALQKDVPNWL